MTHPIIESRPLRRLAGCLLLGAMTYVAADGTPGQTAQAGPTIQSVEPSVAFEGGKVDIEGTHLSGVTRVIFSGNAPARFKVISDKELEVTVPPDASNGPIQVISPAGRARSELVFVVDSAP